MSASRLRMSPGSDRNTGPVGGASRGLGGAVHEPRQVVEPVDLDGPFHERPAIVGRSADRIGS